MFIILINVVNKMQLSIQVVIKGGTFWIPCANDHLELNEPEKSFFDTKSFEYVFFFIAHALKTMK